MCIASPSRDVRRRIYNWLLRPVRACPAGNGDRDGVSDVHGELRRECATYVVAFTMAAPGGNVEFTANCVGNVYAVAVAASPGAHNIQDLAHRERRRECTVAGRRRGRVPGYYRGARGLVLAPGAASAHFHHYYLGFVGSCLCTLATDTSMVAQAMLLGIYLHGTSLFGVERVFYPEVVGDAGPTSSVVAPQYARNLNANTRYGGARTDGCGQAGPASA